MIPIPVISQPPFHPRQLFSALQGAWLEPVVGNIWQENTGVTPTTTGGQTIGKISDQSGWGNNATQATVGNRPLLGRRYNLLTNSVFAGAVAGTPGTAPTGYTFAFNTGTLTTVDFSADASAELTLTAANQRWVIFQALTVAENTSYTHSITVKSNPNGLAFANILGYTGAPAGSTITRTANGASVSSSYVPVAGDRIASTLAVSTTTSSVGFRYGIGTGADVTGTVIITKPQLEIGSTATAYQRITTATDYDYGQYPAAVHDTTDSLVVSLPSINVRRNLLTYSEQFDNGVWSKSSGGTGSVSVVTQNYGLAPDGTATADRVQLALNGGTTSSDFSSISQLNTETAQKTFSVYLRSLSGTPVVLLVDTGSINNRIAVTVTSAWQRFTYSPPAGANTAIGLRLRGSLGSADSADILVWGAQLELGSVATDYQKVTDWTSEAYSSNGSVYFATPVGMSALHGQSMGTTYQLPALSTDIYSWIVVPQRLSAVLESRLERYMLRKAGLVEPDYLLDDDGNQLMSDDYELLLRQ